MRCLERFSTQPCSAYFSRNPCPTAANITLMLIYAYLIHFSSFCELKCSPAGPAGTPKPITPPQSIHAYLKREEISHASSPRLQPRTSALIGKVQEVLPTLVQKEDALGSGTSSRREAGAPIKQLPVVAEERASQLMKDLKVDNGHLNSEVVKELEAAKACLDRASTLLMVS